MKLLAAGDKVENEDGQLFEVLWVERVSRSHFDVRLRRVGYPFEVSHPMRYLADAPSGFTRVGVEPYKTVWQRLQERAKAPMDRDDTTDELLFGFNMTGHGP